MSLTPHDPVGRVGAAELERWLANTHRLLDRSRRQALRRWQGSRRFDVKSDGSPVTAADRDLEASMRRWLRLHHPLHGIAGEELGDVNPGADCVWLLDPIDGTKSFVCGLPLWGSLVTLLHRGRPVLGLIDAPVLAQRWVGVAGQDTTVLRGDGRAVRCQASRCADLASARLCLPAPDAFSAREAAAVRALASRVALRRYGGDCCSYGALAEGGLDVIVEAGLDDHDFLPMVPIVEGAGGVISDWRGRALRRASSGRVVVAATPALHAQALAELARVLE
jgi:histidinol phosphatase-like enzyme (inositol monophosphatase family)